MQLQLLGELLPDRAQVLLPGMRRARNVVPTLDGYTSMEGLEAIQGVTELDAECRGYGSGRVNQLTWAAAGTSQDVYSQSTLQKDTISNPSHVELADDHRWIFDQYETELNSFKGRILATSGLNNPPRSTVPQLIDGTNDWQSLSADASFANVSTVFRDFYVLGDISGRGVNQTAIGRNEAAIHWSAAGDPTNWPQVGTDAAADALSDFNIFQGNGGPVTAIVSAREYALVFRTREVWRMDFVGGNDIMAFRLLDDHRGCIVRDGAISVGTETYFPSESGWLACDGANVRSIGLEKVDRTWRESTDFSRAFARCSVVYDPSRKMIWWNFPQESRVWGYHNELDRWTTLETFLQWIGTSLPTTGSTMDTTDNYGDSNMDATVSTTPPIDLGDVNMDSLTSETFDEVLVGFTSSNLLSSFTSRTNPLQGELGGGDYADPEGYRMLLRNVRPIYNSESPGMVTMRVDSRLNAGDEPLEGDTKSENGKGRIPYRTAGRYLRPFFQFSAYIEQFRGFQAQIERKGAL